MRGVRKVYFLPGSGGEGNALEQVDGPGGVGKVHVQGDGLGGELYAGNPGIVVALGPGAHVEFVDGAPLGVRTHPQGLAFGFGSGRETNPVAAAQQHVQHGLGALQIGFLVSQSPAAHADHQVDRGAQARGFALNGLDDGLGGRGLGVLELGEKDQAHLAAGNVDNLALDLAREGFPSGGWGKAAIGEHSGLLRTERSGLVAKAVEGLGQGGPGLVFGFFLSVVRKKLVRPCHENRPAAGVGRCANAFEKGGPPGQAAKGLVAADRAGDERAPPCWS